MTKPSQLAHRALFVFLLTLGLTLSACDSESLSAPPQPTPQPAPQPGAPNLSKLEIATPDDAELIFSSVKGTVSDAQHITLKNVGNAPLDLEALALAGPDASAFTLKVPNLPRKIEPGSALEATIAFVPGSAGSKTAQLDIVSSDVQAPDVGLYGLGSEGEQGENEPPLQQVVSTLGYDVNVGATSLSLGSGDEAVGDEVLAPLFEKAGSGPVTLEVVARYSPEKVFPYGFFTLDAAQPVTQEVGVVGASEAQKLLPARASGTTTFDPGLVPFGVYGQAGGETQYSLDGLNQGDIRHALRVYPLKDRSGTLIPNSFLIGLEEAQNGDYQDALFVISNVKVAHTTLPASLLP